MLLPMEPGKHGGKADGAAAAAELPCVFAPALFAGSARCELARRLTVGEGEKINYLLPAKDTSLSAEATVIHKGKKFAVSDVDVKSDNGQIVAKAIVTCVIF